MRQPGEPPEGEALRSTRDGHRARRPNPAAEPGLSLPLFGFVEHEP